jgi:dTMP kinase
VLITFEGIDGCGKTTQIELLKGVIASNGHRVEVFREPGGTQVSEQIRAILLDNGSDIHPVTELLLFSSARSQLISSRVKPILNDGGVVILDRFYDSTVAYQGYGRQSVPLSEIQSINKVASHGLKPDLTFYLRLDLLTAKNRRSATPEDRMEKSGDEFFEKIIQGYDQMAAEDQRFVVLDATLDIQSLHEAIWTRVKYILSLLS